jgi:hypothetical protein
MTSSLKDIPPLLHDARLTDCRWDRHLKTLDLSFQCLRRNVDGTPIKDSTVDLKLGGVERIVAHYSPASVTVRPSEFETGSRLTLADLEEWPQGAVEAHLAINSPQAEFDATTACVREALVGDPEDRPDASPLRVHVTFEPHNYGPQGTVLGLSIDCDSLGPFTNGVPLDIGTWERQYEAWWAGWRGHWAATPPSFETSGRLEPLHQAATALGDRPRRSVQPAGDLAVRHAVSEQVGHLPLERVQSCEEPLHLFMEDEGLQRAWAALGHLVHACALPLVQAVPGVPELRPDAGQITPGQGGSHPAPCPDRGRQVRLLRLPSEPPGQYEGDGLEIGAAQPGGCVVGDDGGDGRELVNGHQPDLRGC